MSEQGRIRLQVQYTVGVFKYGWQWKPIHNLCVGIPRKLCRKNAE